MIGSVIRTHLPIMNIGTCKTCEWWDKTRYMPRCVPGKSSKMKMTRPCMYMRTVSDPIELTADDYACIHWEGEQRTGDEVV